MENSLEITLSLLLKLKTTCYIYSTTIVRSSKARGKKHKIIDNFVTDSSLVFKEHPLRDDCYNSLNTLVCQRVNRQNGSLTGYHMRGCMCACVFQMKTSCWTLL